jgi:hypothetical protein
MLQKCCGMSDHVVVAVCWTYASNAAQHGMIVWKILFDLLQCIGFLVSRGSSHDSNASASVLEETGNDFLDSRS